MPSCPDITLSLDWEGRTFSKQNDVFPCRNVSVSAALFSKKEIPTVLIGEFGGM